MRELLQTVQRLAARHGFFMYWREIGRDSAESQEKAKLKIHFEREMDLFFEGSAPLIKTENEIERL